MLLSRHCRLPATGPGTPTKSSPSSEVPGWSNGYYGLRRYLKVLQTSASGPWERDEENIHKESVKGPHLWLRCLPLPVATEGLDSSQEQRGSQRLFMLAGFAFVCFVFLKVHMVTYVKGGGVPNHRCYNHK